MTKNQILKQQLSDKVFCCCHNLKTEERESIGSFKTEKKLWLIFGVYFLFFKSPADPMKTTTIAFASIHEPKFIRSAFEPVAG